jgi:ribose transport system substrate-binding protein
MKLRKLVFLLVLIPLLFATCSKQGDSTAGKERNLRFTFVCPINGNVYWNMAVEGMNAAAKELGGIDINVVGPTQLNVEQFIKDLDSTIAANVDGIISMCLSEEMMKPGVASAAEKNIPFIFIDSDGPNTARLAYIGTDNRDAGKLAGEAMLRLTGGTANIAIMTPVLDSVNFINRMDGFKDGISSSPNMKILTTEVTPDILTGAQRTQQVLTAYPECNAIFTSDGQTSKGVAQTLIERNMVGKVTLVSFDEDKELLDRIKEGSIAATTTQQPYLMGYEGVKLLKSIIDGNPITQVITITPCEIVDSSNVDEFLAKY